MLLAFKQHFETAEVILYLYSTNNAGFLSQIATIFFLKQEHVFSRFFPLNFLNC